MHFPSIQMFSTAPASSSAWERTWQQLLCQSFWENADRYFNGYIWYAKAARDARRASYPMLRGVSHQGPSILSIAGRHPTPTQTSATPGWSNCLLRSSPGLGDRRSPRAQATHAAGLRNCAEHLKGFQGTQTISHQPPVSGNASLIPLPARSNSSQI